MRKLPQFECISCCAQIDFRQRMSKRRR